MDDFYAAISLLTDSIKHIARYKQWIGGDQIKVLFARCPIRNPKQSDRHTNTPDQHEHARYPGLFQLLHHGIEAFRSDGAQHAKQVSGKVNLGVVRLWIQPLQFL